MPTDQYGFPIISSDPGQEAELWQMLRIPRADPLLPIMDDLRTLTNALASADQINPQQPSFARLFMLMGV